jgi:hypothetical protein
MTGRQNRNPWILRLLVPPLILLVVLGCGGGGGGTKNSGEETPPPNRLLQAIETAVSALDEEAEQGVALEKLYVGNELAGNLLPMARGDVAAGNPPCVSVDTEGETLILSFDGSEACRSVSGTLRITAVSSDFGDPSILVTEISLIDFDTGDGCLINGDERSTVTIDGIHITVVCTYTDLDLCGQTISGQLVLDGEPPNDWQIEMEAHTYRYGSGAEAEVEVAWQPETGIMQGEAAVRLDGRTYAMAVEGVIIDPTCGLPTSGSLSITDPEGSTSQATFTETTCEAPQVSVRHRGSTEAWTLFDTP